MTDTSSQRIALVTGASRGIGRATAIALARTGAHVIAVARTVGALEDLDDEIKANGGTASLVPHDLKDFDGLDRLGAALYERYGRLDMLVGNAGILGPLSPLGHIEPKAWDEVMAVNVTANWRLIRSMDPLLKASPAGRAVFVTSGASWKANAYWGPYGVSKAALDVLVRTYAAETVKTPIRVNLLSPGPTRTKMRAAAMPGEDPMTLPAPEALAEVVVRLCAADVTETGAVYDFRTSRFMRFRGPD
jgi:NAD(P)-dependent dehydrogenase (short-subunit alcohol dehydrogenase family)